MRGLRGAGKGLTAIAIFVMASLTPAPTQASAAQLTLPGEGSQQVAPDHMRPASDIIDPVAVTHLSHAESPAAVASAGPRTDRILFIRGYWTSSHPSTPSKTTAGDIFIDQTDAWFQTVSGGRYAVSGKVTPWLRIPKPYSCYDSYRLVSQAIRKARARGIHVNAFDRFILYVPCSAGSVAGVGQAPGNQVTIFGKAGLYPEVSVHEQGHNLGLQHAGSLKCHHHGKRVTFSNRCRLSAYGDWFDAMGAPNDPAQFNAFELKRIGWLRSLATVRKTATKTLHAADGPTGLAALKVPTSKHTYWVELRTQAGVDDHLPDGTAGVQIRVQRRDRTALLDLQPGGQGDVPATTPSS